MKSCSGGGETAAAAAAASKKTKKAAAAAAGDGGREQALQRAAHSNFKLATLTCRDCATAAGLGVS